MKQSINIRLIVLILITALVGLWLVLNVGGQITALVNFTTVGAMALFGGAYFTHRSKAYLFPLLTLFLSDVIMMHTYMNEYRSGLLYQGWYWTYGAFAITVFLCNTLIKKANVRNVVLAAFSAALAHFVITNFSVWSGGGIDITTGQPYTKDWVGLIKCYTLVIPFLKNLLLGILLYSGLLFGIFQLAQQQFPSLHNTKTA